jgi:hypothetical protein
MGYLITQIIICLLIAAIIGFIIGWLLRGLGCNNNEEAYEGANLNDSNAAATSSSGINTLSSAGSAAATGAPVTKAPVKSHQIERIEGIGKSLGNYLRNIGVKTTLDLIEKCSTQSGFQQVVKAAEVVEPVVTQWVSRADLMRIPGVDGQYSELMEVSDIKSVQDLGNAEAQALTSKMQTVNQREHRIPDSIPLPDVNMVANWIRDAKTLPEKI